MNNRLSLSDAMRSIKKAVAKIFCGVMNFPPTPKWFYDSRHTLNNVTEKVTKVSMALAASETISFNNGCPNVPVAIDGTWQKRGHTSLNGGAAALSLDNGKVVEVEILLRKCSCNFNSNVHSDECSASYIVNSRGMEVCVFVEEKTKPKFNLLCYPITSDIDTTPEDLPLDLIDLKSDYSVKEIFIALCDFHKSLSDEKFPSVKKFDG
ncbi:uncharacterized protein TNCV_1951 [Trichonephila clavipes]|nr:uncharacterized protein TNCV_1951 [Trichonephila clavipes]